MSTPEQPYNLRGGRKQQPLNPAAQLILDACAKMRASNAEARKHLPGPGMGGLDFDSYDRRLGEIEQLLRLGTPGSFQQANELRESLYLDMEADTAEMVGAAQERIVRFTDMLVVRAEEKKFEMSSEQRDDLDDMLEPYQDKFRQEMLKTLPIETKRDIEKEKRRLEQEGTGLD